VSRSTLLVFVSYLLLSIVMTWPLAPGLTRDVPGDLGDSLLNMWILAWGAEQVPRLLSGAISLDAYWNANIFHPEPLALSFSEHLFGQVVQIIPVYHLTGNIILAYNLLFVSSFALSGLGMYVLVRDMVGDANDGAAFSGPAFIAGLIYAFVPFRIAQVAHIQSLSSQWMPLALYGFRRYVISRRPSALAGGAVALLMQNWSNGYYLIFFAPFVLLFVVHQMAAARRLTDGRMWGAFGVAAAGVALATWPFLALYLEAQRVHGFERTLGEVIRFSADVYSYFTAPEALRVWGPIVQAFPKPEGELFFGLVPLLLFAIAIAGHLRIDLRSRRVAVLTAIIAVQLAGLVGVLATGGFVTSFLNVPIRATHPARILSGVVLATAALVALSPDVRSRLRAAWASPLTLAIALTVLAAWLSLGPLPQTRGQPLSGLGLYGTLYEHVPGFSGLRVPARYAMVAALFLSIVAGYGARVVVGRLARPLFGVAAMAALLLIDLAFAPMAVNATWAADAGIAPPDRVEPAARAPAVYRQLAAMPDAQVVAEFPFGDPAWELRYVYYSTVHWKRLVNGYSGGFPQRYKVRVARLQRVADDPVAAWQTLADAGTTHVVVHDAALANEAAGIHAWLQSQGARTVGRYGSDVLYSLRQ
jgi:hypothetical protein